MAYILVAPSMLHVCFPAVSRVGCRFSDCLFSDHHGIIVTRTSNPWNLNKPFMAVYASAEAPHFVLPACPVPVLSYVPVVELCVWRRFSVPAATAM